MPSVVEKDKKGKRGRGARMQAEPGKRSVIVGCSDGEGERQRNTTGSGEVGLTKTPLYN